MKKWTADVYVVHFVPKSMDNINCTKSLKTKENDLSILL